MSGVAPIENSHIAFAGELADAARRLLAEFAGDPLAVDVKPDRSLVTQMDMMIETRLREMIAARFPDHGIIGEEQDWDRAGAHAVWVLDPIDGTRAFIAGLPVWTTLIALRQEGEPVLSSIGQPYVGEVFIGGPETGSRLVTRDGETPLKARAAVTPNTAVRSAADSPAVSDRASAMTLA